MRRTFFALGVGVILTIIVAYAATLSVNGGTIQAGTDEYLKCDDAVEVAGWGLETSDNSVRFVRIGDINAACFDDAMFVKVEDGSGGTIFYGSVDPIDTSPVKIDFSSPYPAPEDIAKLTIWIEGP